MDREENQVNRYNNVMNNILFKEQFHVHVTLMNILHRYIFYESLLANAEKG